MKFSQFLNETPMMVDDRVSKDNTTDKWAKSIRDEAIQSIHDEISGANKDFNYEPKFKYLDEFKENGYKFEQFSLFQYGNIYIVTKGDKLSCVVKFDKFEKEYMYIEIIAKHDASSDEIVNIVYMLGKKLGKKGLLSGSHQTTGGRNMWRNIIKRADKEGLKFGYYERNNRHESDVGATEFIKFADAELYDTTTSRDRSKTKFKLFVEF